MKGWQKILWTEDRKSMEGLDDADPTQLPCLDSDSDEEETTGKVKKEQQAESQSDLEDALEKQMEQDYPKDQRSAYHMPHARQNHLFLNIHYPFKFSCRLPD